MSEVYRTNWKLREQSGAYYRRSQRGTEEKGNLEKELET
jgi:hypothetical protein